MLSSSDICLHPSSVNPRLYCVFKTKSVSTKALGNRAVCHLTDFNETLSDSRVYSRTKKDKVVFVLLFSGGRLTNPRFFLVFTKEIASKKVKCMKLSLQWY